jgi:hypothetical protein
VTADFRASLDPARFSSRRVFIVLHDFAAGVAGRKPGKLGEMGARGWACLDERQAPVSSQSKIITQSGLREG